MYLLLSKYQISEQKWQTKIDFFAANGIESTIHSSANQCYDNHGCESIWHGVISVFKILKTVLVHKFILRLLPVAKKEHYNVLYKNEKIGFDLCLIGTSMF